MNSRRLIHSITSSAAIRGTVVTELFSRDRARIVYMSAAPLSAALAAQILGRLQMLTKGASWRGRPYRNSIRSRAYLSTLSASSRLSGS
jgi:hypothetical protein